MRTGNWKRHPTRGRWRWRHSLCNRGARIGFAPPEVLARFALAFSCPPPRVFKAGGRALPCLNSGRGPFTFPCLGRGSPFALALFAFHHTRQAYFPSRKREECGPCGQVKRVGCEYVAHLPACAGKRGQRPFLGSSSPNPVSRAGATGWRAQSLDYLSRTPRTLPRESRSYCLAEPWLFLPGDSMSA